MCIIPLYRGGDNKPVAIKIFVIFLFVDIGYDLFSCNSLIRNKED
jgi:hypothetical protein